MCETPPPRLANLLIERSKRLPQVVLRDVPSEHYAGNAREVVVQTCPEPRVDNLVAKIVCHLKMDDGIAASGAEAMNVNVDPLRAEKRAEDLRHRRCDGTVSCRVFRMIRCRQERPPADLLERRRVPIVKPWDGTRTVSRDRGLVDGCNWPPKQIVVFREETRDERVSADGVDHRCQPRRLKQSEAFIFGDFAREAIVLANDIRRPESRNRRLLRCSRRASRLAVALDLAERLRPLPALKRWRRIRKELIGALQNERPHLTYPGSLRRSECRRAQAPHGRAGRKRWERRRHADGRHPSVAAAQAEDVVRGP